SAGGGGCRHVAGMTARTVQLAVGRGGSAAREQRRHARRAARDERCTGEWTLLPCASCATPAPSPAGGTSSLGTTAGDSVSEPRGASGSAIRSTTAGRCRLLRRRSRAPLRDGTGLGEPVQLERPVQGDRDGETGARRHVAGELLSLEDGVARAPHHVDAPPLHDLGDVLSRRGRLGAVLLDDLHGEEAALERIRDPWIGGGEDLVVLLR